MANVSIKISQLKQIANSSITNDDFLPIVDSGSLRTYRITLGDIISKASQNVTLPTGSDQQILYSNGNVIFGDDSLKFNYVSKSLQNGLSSSAIGLYSHAGGRNTYAYGDYQSVVGQFNVNSPHNTTSLFIVGGGTNDGNRADILLVNSGGLIVNGNISASNMTGSLLGTASYSDNSISSSYALTSSYALNGGTGGSSQWTDIAGGINYTGGKVSINQNTPQYSFDVNGTIGNSQTSDYFISTGSYNSYFNAHGGKVGIGTLTPTATLSVAGDISASGITASNISAINITASSAWFGQAAPDEAAISASLYVTANTNPAYKYVLDIDTGGVSSVEGLHVMSGSGYVGIGTDNPLNKLEVIGNISASGYVVGNTVTSSNDIYIGGYLKNGQGDNPAGSNFVGIDAGYNATNADGSNFFGYQAGYNATNSDHSNFIGYRAGSGSNDAGSSNFIGNYAGNSAANSYNSNFIGAYAGEAATGANYSNFFGYGAGNYATDSNRSNFFGYFAGHSAVNAYRSNFFGHYAGYQAVSSNYSNFIGNSAGGSATSASYSNFIGNSAGQGAAYANNSIFIGYHAGNGDTVNNSVGPNSSILIGDYAKTNGYNDSIAIGKGTANSTNNQFNIGNVLFGLNIYSGSSATSIPQTNAMVGIGNNNPAYALDVSGSGNFTSGIVIAADIVPTTITGSMFYSASTLWVFTGTSNDYGAGVGWSTASLSI